MVGILGSGFGLYGYMPAVVECTNGKIALPERYKTKFAARPELASFSACIVWIADDDTFFKSIDTLIICVSPEKQFDVVTQALTFPNITHLLLEKPLAVNPERSAILLNKLTGSGKFFRIGYNFQYTDWAKSLIGALNTISPQQVKINWQFQAYHFKHDLHNWKRANSQGGGAIRFYGIHLIALLAGCGACKVVSSVCKGFSDDEVTQWNATIEIDERHTIVIEVDSNAVSNLFFIGVNQENNLATINREVSYTLNDPFNENEPAGDLDRRINYLKPVISDLLSQSSQQYWCQNYFKVNELWSEIESAPSRIAYY